MSIESLQRQIAETEKNLSLIEDRISEYVESTTIPLQLVKEKRNTQMRLDELRAALDRIPIGLRRAGVEQPPIDLLLFMADREAQDYDMDDLLTRLGNRPTQPMICIIHGDQRQGHDKFLERLRHVSLPKLLALDSNTSVVSKPVNWPYPLDDINLLPVRLRRNLADALVGHTRATDEEVQRTIATSPGPVLLHTLVDEQSWRRHGVQIVNHFLRFWRDWRTAPQYGLFICLCIKYQAQQRDATDRGLWQRLWRRHREIVAIDAEISMALSQLDPQQFHPLICVVLPKLDNVERPQLENWARLEATQNYVRAKRLDIFSAINTIYETWQTENACDGIPMDALVERLRTLLA